MGPFELLPGVGVLLPHGAGVLRFGSTEREAQWMTATLADVRAGWACGTEWAFTARCDDVVIMGRATGAAEGLDGVLFERCDRDPIWPARTPVTWRDIDLLGYSAAEVLAAIAAEFGTADMMVLGRELGLTVAKGRRMGGGARSASRTAEYMVSVTLTPVMVTASLVASGVVI